MAVITHQSGLEIRRLFGKDAMGREAEIRFDKIGLDRVVVARHDRDTGKRTRLVTGSIKETNEFYQLWVNNGWKELDPDMSRLL